MLRASRRLPVVKFRRLAHGRTPAQWKYLDGLLERLQSIPVKIENFETKGAGLVATSNIPQGSIIFSEQPFCVVPRFPSQNEFTCKHCLRSTVTIQDLVKNTSLEGREDVLALSKFISSIHESSHKCIEPYHQLDQRDIQVVEYLQSKETGDPTMSKLMIYIYFNIFDNFKKNISNGLNKNEAFLKATEPIDNLMAFVFDSVAKMPILEDKKQDQEFLEGDFGKIMEDIPSEFKFFSYENFIKYYVKVNLNYFEIVTYSPFFEMINGNTTFWPSDTQQTEFLQLHKKSVTEILNEIIISFGSEKPPDTNILFGRGVGVYPFSALMNHHCCNNVEVKPTTNATMQWIAKKTILKGEELTIAYVDTNLEMSQRQEFLQGHHFFKCPCLTDCTIEKN